MYYKNKFSRFVLRKNLLKRIGFRVRKDLRKLLKNEFDDIKNLYQLTGGSPKHIIDGGANIGFVTWQFHKQFPDAEIYAFEPNPKVFKKLEESYRENERIHSINAGLGQLSERKTFHPNKNSGTSSFLAPNQFHKEHMAKNPEQDITMDVLSLEDAMQKYSLTKIDILKLDVEGYELEVLKGAQQLLEDKKIDLIFLEVNLTPTYEEQPLIEDITQYLRHYNYILYNIYGSHETKYNQALLTNLLFVRPGFISQLNS